MDLGISKKENWDSFEIVYEPGLLIDSSIISKENIEPSPKVESNFNATK